LTKVLAFNDTEGAISLFNLFSNSIACVILEPVGATFPTNDFIYTLRDLCDKNGALLIYDEVLTGFRISRNGASSLIGVTPDLSCFGKGVANGYPLSVLAGKRKFMKQVENIFFSGTFGGEALSLSAAKSVLLQIRDDGLIEALYDKGREIEKRVNKVMADLKITFLELSGHPSWLFLKWNVPEPEINEVKTLFLQEMFARGVLILNTHNVMTSLKKKDIESIVVSYRETLSLLLEAFQNKNYSKYLKVDAIQPLFQIRK
jgi:glutamate-1-semialdehyde aminotransferase